jgi:hypothetical protein
VAVAGLASPLRAVVFSAWVTPTPPGVAETLFEIELEAVTVAMLWKVAGMP